ncbi:MAG: hypothetical protein V3T17_05840 [Pseudomonadales bacterium]
MAYRSVGGMPNKISLDSLDDVQIPDLENESREEELFEVTEAKSHKEHKLLEAHETTLSIARARIRKLEIENDDLAMLGPHRRMYSWWILGFVISFVLVTFSVLLMSSFQIEAITEDKASSFRTLIKLDNEVIMTLLATNTVQVVGLLYVVAKWLFPTKSVKKPEPET